MRNQNEIKKIVPAEKASDLKRGKKNIKTLIYFIISFSVIFGLFEGLVAIEFKPVYPIYLIILTILLVLFLFFNKGFFFRAAGTRHAARTVERGEKGRFLYALGT